MRDREIGSDYDRCKDSTILWSRSSSDASRNMQQDHLFTVETGTSHHIIRPRIENAGSGRQTGRSNVRETGATPPTGWTYGQTGSDRPSRRTHLGQTGASLHDGSVHLGENRASRHKGSVHLGETGASRHNRSVHLGETEAICSTGRPHLGETGAICPTRTTYAGETGAGCQTQRPNVGETGASCPTQRIHVGKTGSGCPIPRLHIRETGASCPIQMQYVGETWVGCPTRMQHVGETGAGCPNGFLHVGKTGATSEPKIPGYDGKEDWTVWINRFEAIAGLRRWDEDRKLDCLLPKLQGKVGEYAFAVLPKQILGNYKELIGELNSVFRKVEIPSAFAAKFHNRMQGEDESIEDYAADLRILYYKAYKHRNKQIREEDLMQRFLYGLRDEEMRFAVEYHKEPVSLDEAVYYAVEYEELRDRIFEGQFADKAFSNQGWKECNQYDMHHNKTVDCCYQDRPLKTIKAIAQRPTDQTVKNEEQQSQNEVFKALLQIKDSLHALANDRSRDSHWKSHHADTHVGYGCKSGDPSLRNCDDRNSDNLFRAEDSRDDKKLLPQEVCSSDTGRNVNCLTHLPEEGTSSECRTCQLLTDQEQRWRSSDIFQAYSGEVGKDSRDADHEQPDDIRTVVLNSYKNSENSNNVETWVSNFQIGNEFTCQNYTPEQKLGGDDSCKNGAYKQMTSLMLLPRNKLLPCKGEIPPKCLLERLWQILDGVSVAA